MQREKFPWEKGINLHPPPLAVQVGQLWEMPGNISLLGDLVPKCPTEAACDKEGLDYAVPPALPAPAPPRSSRWALASASC